MGIPLHAVVMLNFGTFAAWAATSSQPNVVVILADDLGWSDTTLNGTTKFYQTPNVERLAALIEKFLVETKAVVPLANPAFNPAKYHPELEGKPTNKDKLVDHIRKND